MAPKKGSDPKGYNEEGKVSVESSADGFETNIRVGTGDNHSHTIIRNGQVVFDKGVDPNGNTFTFTNDQISNDSNAHGLFGGDNVPDAEDR